MDFALLEEYSLAKKENLNGFMRNKLDTECLRLRNESKQMQKFLSILTDISKTQTNMYTSTWIPYSKIKSLTSKHKKLKVNQLLSKAIENKWLIQHFNKYKFAKSIGFNSVLKEKKKLNVETRVYVDYFK